MSQEQLLGCPGRAEGKEVAAIKPERWVEPYGTLICQAGSSASLDRRGEPWKVLSR